ncbi:glycoside hydrolase family 43 protein [Cohnella fermenti]|uniref:Glycosyl hydrolase 43 family protein n=1 Tax=Cohnella fermenti TaxID=2565925 RepID=A0A4S4BMN4_9BACL|nr:glycoside hydrolase 43 family protein [Cohnella fermenti]THF75162.1 glycosyl hydrolase 43 family protein [Cohnella fermenti]
MSTANVANPVLWADYPDPSVIRVGASYYMVSTSMHSMPGCPILKSSDLLHWELVNYVYDTFEDNDAHNLRNGSHIYGKGSWAATLRQHGGLFYVGFSSLDTNQFYVYRTADIEKGSWERFVIPGLHHDPSLLFDDGRVFVFHGNGDIRIRELTADATAVKPDGIDQLLFETAREGIGLRCEGCHAYKRNGYYYLFFIEWPRTGNGRRRQLAYRSSELLGPYESRIVLDDNLDYGNNGVAQGGIVDTPDGDWYAVLFQDHGAVGRIPCVVPVSWEDDWPVFGVNGRVPKTLAAGSAPASLAPLVTSDEFEYERNKLSLNWQWNHNPDNELWSVTDRPGWLRLKTGSLADSVEFARNTLTQRTEGPSCVATALLDATSMLPGDRAGMVALQGRFGAVGLRVEEDGAKRIVMCSTGSPEAGRADVESSGMGDAGKNGGEMVVWSAPYEGETVHLRIEFDFRTGSGLNSGSNVSVDRAFFSYSSDGETWISAGEPLQMRYALDHFMGCRIGLFHYASRSVGGWADFDYFRYVRQQ